MPNQQTKAGKNSLLQGFSVHNLWWLALACISIALDQYTKHIASLHLVYNESVPVLPFLNWTLLHNFGAAFSFLSDAGGWQRYFFTGLAGIVSVIFTVWILRMPRQLTILPLALALILGGAIGNLIDRVTLGYVVDFIHVFYQTSHFPAFNIADGSITIGTILLIWDTFFLEKHRIAKANAAAE
jgi:signal peptidase II